MKKLILCLTVLAFACAMSYANGGPGDYSQQVKQNTADITAVELSTAALDAAITAEEAARIAQDQLIGRVTDQFMNEVDPSFTGLMSGGTYYGDGSGIFNIGTTTTNPSVMPAKAGENIVKGKAVYLSGVTGNNPEVSYASRNGATHEEQEPIGICGLTANTNAETLVILKGIVQGIKTNYSGWANGNELYLDNTGDLTDVKPSSGTWVFMGYVGRVHASNGSIIVDASHPEYRICAPVDSPVVIRMSIGRGIEHRDYDDTLKYSNTTSSAEYKVPLGATEFITGGNVDGIDVSEFANDVTASTDSIATAVLSLLLSSTAGDLYTHNGTSPSVIGIGSADQVLTSDGTNAEWKAAGGGGNKNRHERFRTADFVLPSVKQAGIDKVEWDIAGTTYTTQIWWFDPDNDEAVFANTLCWSDQYAGGNIDITAVLVSSGACDVLKRCKYGLEYSTGTALGSATWNALTEATWTPPQTGNYEVFLATYQITSTLPVDNYGLRIRFFRAADDAADTIPQEIGISELRLDWVAD